MRGRLSRPFSDTTTFCVGVLAVGMRTGGTHGMSVLVPLASPAFFWRFEQWRQILQLRREEHREFTSSDVHAVFFHIPCCFVFC